MHPADRLILAKEADRIDAKNKYQEAILLTAVAPRDDKGKFLSKYKQQLLLRIFPDEEDKMKLAIALNNLAAPRTGYTVNEYTIGKK
ncbi:MAG: hypothetical protein KOO65_08545 [Desulfobacterales bacterium]|nr:hypothetical protein [Desulfobacterales bacterium]